jgi:flagellar basal body-associated protein FliL
MAKHQEEKHLNAKQQAYEKKQAAKGETIIKWIIGVLIALAIVYMGWTFWLMS